MTELHHPLVSVVIPAYNAARFIRRAVDSALDQTWQSREIVVVNDGSTDDTDRVLAEYGDSIRVIHKPNGGLSSARNRGIRESRGDYVAFLDADDYWLPEKLRRQVEALSNPKIGFCSTRARLEDAAGNELGEWKCPLIEETLLKTLFLQNGSIPGSGSGVMVRRQLFDKIGIFDESLGSLEDIDMWMRLASVTDYRCIDEPLTVIIKQPGSMSTNLAVMRHSASRVMRKNRQLLCEKARGRFWRYSYAGMLTDYAKAEYRNGNTGKALALLARALFNSPIDRARLILGLALSMLTEKLTAT